jgi:hypothetical protein
MASPCVSLAKSRRPVVPALTAAFLGVSTTLAGTLQDLPHPARRPSPPKLSVLVALADPGFDSETAQRFVRRLQSLPHPWRTCVGSGGADFYTPLPTESQRPNPHLDSTTLLFYLGNGDPDGWFAGSVIVKPGDVHVGDSFTPADPYGLRYFWQCSCQGFANGVPWPLTSTSKVRDYIRPWEFSYSAVDPRDHRNVYFRWNKPLGSNVRMACGASSFIGCYLPEVESILDNLEFRSLDVADSFLAALHSQTSFIPVCLVRGGSRPTDTPLYDKRFLTYENAGDQEYFHLEYVRDYLKREHYDLATHANQLRRLTEMTKNVHDYAGVSTFLRGQPDYRKRSLYTTAPSAALDALLEWAPRATNLDDCELTSEGIIACHLGELGEAVPAPPDRFPDEDDPYVRAARSFVRAKGWCSSELPCSKPFAYRLLIDTLKIPGTPGEKAPEPTHRQKSVIVVYKRLLVKPVRPDDPELVELGRNGTILVQINNREKVVNASLVDHDVTFEKPVETRTLEQALSAARAKLVDGVHYADQPAYEIIGFRPTTEGGFTLRPTHVFYFVPKEEISPREFPPRVIDVPLDASQPALLAQ